MLPFDYKNNMIFTMVERGHNHTLPPPPTTFLLLQDHNKFQLLAYFTKVKMSLKIINCLLSTLSL